MRGNDDDKTERPLLALIGHWWKIERVLLARLFATRTAYFCLAGFLLKRIAFTSEGFIFQYASEKFGWKLRETTWLRVSAAAGAIVTTLIICPLLSWFCKRKRYSTHKLDLWIVRVCLIVLCISFMMAFKAPLASWLFPGSLLDLYPTRKDTNMLTRTFLAMLGMGLGEGTEPALQGLISSVTEPSDYSQLFGTIALVDSMAELVGGPMTASLMSVGRSKHGDSNGLNFLSSAVSHSSFAVYRRRSRADCCLDHVWVTGSVVWTGICEAIGLWM